MPEVWDCSAVFWVCPAISAWQYETSATYGTQHVSRMCQTTKWAGEIHAGERIAQHGSQEKQQHRSSCTWSTILATLQLRQTNTRERVHGFGCNGERRSLKRLDANAAEVDVIGCTQTTAWPLHGNDSELSQACLCIGEGSDQLIFLEDCYGAAAMGNGYASHASRDAAAPVSRDPEPYQFDGSRSSSSFSSFRYIDSNT